MINKINSVCVYCASSTKIDSVYFDAARELGALLGQRQIRLINGAGNMGLMSAVSDAALRAGGEVTGVIPHFMVEQGWHHTGLTQLVEVESMHQRKKTMADLSDAVIALPGGCGTLEELLEIITWKQLGLYLNPIVILSRTISTLCSICSDRRWTKTSCVRSTVPSGMWRRHRRKPWN